MRLSNALLAAVAAVASAARGSLSAEVDDAVGCRDMQGRPVDWFIAFKYPRGTGTTDTQKAGLGFSYMDSNTDLVDPGVSLATKDHAIAHTLGQVYESAKTSGSDLHYLFIDDQAPPKDDGSKGRSSGTRAHQKGEIVYSPSTASGFWLIHSVPRFPPNPDQAYAYEDFAVDYAQSFICVTLTRPGVDKVLEQMTVTWPLVFASANPSGDAKFQAVVDAKNRKEAEDNAVELVTKGGHKFTMFEKDGFWADDLYSKLVVPHYKSNLDTLTWRNGAHTNQEGDFCPYVRNILRFEVSGVAFKATQSHAKVAIAQPGQDVEYTCVGGINRQYSQKKRGGGTLCTTDPRIYKTFASFVKEVEPCESTSSSPPDSSSDTGSVDDKKDKGDGGHTSTAPDDSKRTTTVTRDDTEDDTKVPSTTAGLTSNNPKVSTV